MLGQRIDAMTKHFISQGIIIQITVGSALHYTSRQYIYIIAMAHLTSWTQITFTIITSFMRALNVALVDVTIAVCLRLIDRIRNVRMVELDWSKGVEFNTIIVTEYIFRILALSWLLCAAF